MVQFMQTIQSLVYARSCLTIVMCDSMGAIYPNFERQELLYMVGQGPDIPLKIAQCFAAFHQISVAVKALLISSASSKKL